MSDEKIGFHKGCVDTLLKERQELLKIVQVTEQLLKVHVEELKKLGVDLEKEKK
jgi:hypothetical protein